MGSGQEGTRYCWWKTMLFVKSSRKRTLVMAQDMALDDLDVEERSSI